MIKKRNTIQRKIPFPDKQNTGVLKEDGHLRTVLFLYTQIHSDILGIERRRSQIRQCVAVNVFVDDFPKSFPEIKRLTLV